MGLTYSGFASAGGCISVPGDSVRTDRPLVTAYTDATNATVYLSVLMKMNENNALRLDYRSMDPNLNLSNLNLSNPKA